MSESPPCQREESAILRILLKSGDVVGLTNMGEILAKNKARLRFLLFSVKHALNIFILYLWYGWQLSKSDQLTLDQGRSKLDQADVIGKIDLAEEYRKGGGKVPARCPGSTPRG